MIYVAAEDVHEGDRLRVMLEGRMMASVVIEVKMEVKQGYYAPLTDAGTLMVNGVLASCYANVHSHDLAHWSMGVIRWYDAVLRSVWMKEGSSVSGEDGMHVIPRMLYAVTFMLAPSMLRSS